MNFIHSYQLPNTASIIDVGGGDSNLVDHLLDAGFTNLTVLDISAKALDNAKQRLGARAKKVDWIVSDIISFKPTTTYDLWHDRAAFHFLTAKEQIEKYITIAERSVKEYMIIATFSEVGPKKCSGLDVQQYNEEKLALTLNNGFVKLKCVTEYYTTPFNTTQIFYSAVLKKEIYSYLLS